jgi:tRNA threonylcarbamoyladenosine biosynthesis protein TsaB
LRILAFDSAGAQCAVAVQVDGAIVASDAVAARHGHAELLAPMIADMLRRAGMAASALDRIAVTRGPGGFTGVRVGLATARGLALATGARVYGPTVFEALLLSLDAPAVADCDAVLAAIDSRLEPLFVQLFDRGRAALTPPAALAPAALAGLLPPAIRRVLVVGDAAPRAVVALAAAGAAEATALAMAPDVVALARAAAICPPEALGLPAPLYLAPPAVTPATPARR